MLLNNKIYVVLTTILFFIDIAIFSMTVRNPNYEKFRFETVLTTEDSFPFQLYYEDNLDFNEEKSTAINVKEGKSTVYFEIPMEMDINHLRLDLGYGRHTIIIHNMSVIIGAKTFELEINKVLDSRIQNDARVKLESSDRLVVYTSGDDPYICIDITNYESIKRYIDILKIRTVVCAIIYCIIMDLFGLLVLICLSYKPKHNEIKRHGLYPEQKILVLIVFLICLCGGIMISTKYCPDEYARFILTDYIFRTGRLPKGYEKDVIIPGWGFSYALRPYLTSLIGAFFMRVVSVVTDNPNVIVTMSRMPSIIATLFTCYYCLKIGNEIFEKRIASFAFAVITCFVPQVMFCGMYLNNDSLSLAAVAMGAYYLVKGHKTHWDKVSSVGLAASFALCLLSYYTVCVWIAFACWYCIVSCLSDKTIDKKASFMIKRAIFIAVITFCLSGLFFIRNGLLHNGDFLGIASEELSRQEWIKQGKDLIRYNPGVESSNSISDMVFNNDAGWIVDTTRSFIACFGYLNVPIPTIQYGEYYALIIFATMMFVLIMISKKHNMLSYMIFANFALSSFSVIILSVMQSYYRDYQPQGRYIIIVALLIGFVFGIVAENISITLDSNSSIGDSKNLLIKNMVTIIIIVLWIFQFVRIWFESMTKMII
ncbi:hypothetical protein SAMN05216349_11415 [Oribacterium sp. KHPX15]|nr:hypothetical protein SAMN05216349_11415 [Oribacterium sp. KHPX15]